MKPHLSKLEMMTFAYKWFEQNIGHRYCKNGWDANKAVYYPSKSDLKTMFYVDFEHVNDCFVVVYGGRIYYGSNHNHPRAQETIYTFGRRNENPTLLKTRDDDDALRQVTRDHQRLHVVPVLADGF